MSATDAQTILYSVFPQGQLRAGKIVGAAETIYEEEITGGFIGQYSGNPSLPGYAANNCAQAGGYTPTGTAVTAKAGGGLALAGTSYGILGKIIPALAPIPIIGQVIAGIAAIVLPIIGSIFKHHAQAVAREQGTLCTIVPQINASLAQVDTAVAKGDISAAEADNELDAIDAQYWQATQSITQKGPNTCNAGCDIGNLLDGIIVARKQKYHNAPIYYLKHYWWVGALGLLAFFLLGRGR
jgi:hypothetical protein